MASASIAIASYTNDSSSEVNLACRYVDLHKQDFYLDVTLDMLTHSLVHTNGCMVSLCQTRLATSVSQTGAQREHMQQKNYQYQCGPAFKNPYHGWNSKFFTKIN